MVSLLRPLVYKAIAQELAGMHKARLSLTRGAMPSWSSPGLRIRKLYKETSSSFLFPCLNYTIYRILN